MAGHTPREKDLRHAASADLKGKRPAGTHLARVDDAPRVLERSGEFDLNEVGGARLEGARRVLRSTEQLDPDLVRLHAERARRCCRLLGWGERGKFARVDA